MARAARNVTRTTALARDVEIADSFGARFRGLMRRPTLEAGAGLWLTGTSSIHMLFMRFPIDAVFLGREDEDGQRPVVGVRPDLRPWSGVVWYVRHAEICLELPAGTAAATGTAAGDLVTLDP